MITYPDINDIDYYEFINAHFADYKIPGHKKSLRQICFPTKYEFQIPQKFLAEYINPTTPYKRLLVYHQIGAGKTCSAINICENFKKKYNIIIVLPASLKDNFRTELRTQCASNTYISEADRNLLKTLSPTDPTYKYIIEESNKKISQVYNIYSYNKFIELSKQNLINYKKTLLVIDEIHNMVSSTGSYYKILKQQIQSASNDLRIVIMSATPIFDKPVEIALTMNLLLDSNNQLPTGQAFIDTFIDQVKTKRGLTFRTKNMELFKKYTKGYISYYRGAPPHVFPSSKITLVKTTMSDNQLALYKVILKKESRNINLEDYINTDISNCFFIGTRTVSNIVYPNKKLKEAGFNSLKSSDFQLDKFEKYSPKFVKILKKLKPKSTAFIYSNFKSWGGIYAFSKFIEHQGWKNYQQFGPGKKRYAIWSGDERPEYKDEIKTVFNNINNANGSKIRLILGSPSIKEGVSLLRVQQVHIIEPYWNFSRMRQIIGRAIRFCSHKDMPTDQQFVDVYIYLAVHPSLKKSIDQHIMTMALNKEKVNQSFETALKESAIDCKLFSNANVYADEEPIVCDV